MKLLLTHRFFWPDTAPYGTILKSIALHLATDHDTHVFASRPSYRSDVVATQVDGDSPIAIHRCWVFKAEKGNILKRLANIFIYCVSLFITILRQRPDIVTASTYPPVLAAWTASLAAKIIGAKFVYHMQDIHPEVMEVAQKRSGGLKAAVFKTLRWLDNQTLRRSARIVVLSKDMEQTLLARGFDTLPVRVINNMALEDFGDSQPVSDEYLKPTGKKRFIFAGNLGRFQNLPLLADGIARLFADNPDLELVFLGDGLALAGLKETWGDHPQVRFFPFLPYAQAKQLIADSDVGLVSVDAGIYRVAYPSKVTTYKALGLPILALVEPDSALAEDIRAGAGAVPTSQTPEEIANAAQSLLGSPSPGDTAQTTSQMQEDTLTQWAGLLEECRPRQT